MKLIAVLLAVAFATACAGAGEPRTLESMKISGSPEPSDQVESERAPLSEDLPADPAGPPSEPLPDDGSSVTNPPGTPLPSAALAQATVARETPNVSDEDLRSVVDGLNGLALDLHRRLPAGDNLLLSSPSIGIALAMTYAGAREATAQQMREALRFELPDDRLHAAFNALDRELASRGADAEGTEERPFRLRVSNAVWAQEGMNAKPAYLDTLARHYGAGLRLQDFQNDPEGSRQTINRWVAEQTEDKIRELLAEDQIDTSTRLVLTNAVYFNAAWLYRFDKYETSDGDFTMADGDVVQVPFMRQTRRHRHAAGDGWEAVEMLYDGREVAMLVVVPDPSRLEEVEGQLDLDQVVTGLQERRVDLALPRFAYRASLDLPGTLRSLGMVDVFDPDLADLTGITDLERLFVSVVAHEATIDVNEEGTEAAAATAVGMAASAESGPAVEVRVDRPFLFAIRDLATGTVLFWGRVVDPRA